MYNNMGKIWIIIPEGSHDWILGGLAREIIRYYQNAKVVEINQFESHEDCDLVILMHYSLLLNPRINPLDRSKIVVWFTHFRRDIFTGWLSYYFALHRIKGIMVMNSRDMKRIKSLFMLPKNKVKYVITGVDSEIFFSNDTDSDRQVGFVAGFYERKNPELILKIIKENPDISFKILGRNWTSWSKWNELDALANFDYLELPYSKYPDFYRSMKVIVSCSKKEGGPIPLLEGLASGCYCISSDTGFARDIIIDNVTGKVLSLKASPEDYTREIRKALDLLLDQKVISQSVAIYSWKNYAKSFGEFT